jgi:hypothetical protein
MAILWLHFAESYHSAVTFIYLFFLFLHEVVITMYGDHKTVKYTTLAIRETDLNHLKKIKEEYGFRTLAIAFKEVLKKYMEAKR